MLLKQKSKCLVLSRYPIQTLLNCRIGHKMIWEVKMFAFIMILSAAVRKGYFRVVTGGQGRLPK